MCLETLASDCRGFYINIENMEKDTRRVDLPEEEIELHKYIVWLINTLFFS